jgi:hypothetical protein
MQIPLHDHRYSKYSWENNTTKTQNWACVNDPKEIYFHKLLDKLLKITENITENETNHEDKNPMGETKSCIVSIKND